MFARVSFSTRPVSRCFVVPEQHKHVTSTFHNHIDARIMHVQQQLNDLHDNEVVDVCSLDSMEELSATLADLWYKKEQGPILASVDEYDAHYHDSIEYDL